MKRYFILRDGRQAGPYTVEQLRTMNLNPGTSVWNEKVFDWVKAGTIDTVIAALVDSERRARGRVCHGFVVSSRLVSIASRISRIPRCVQATPAHAKPGRGIDHVTR